MRGTCQSTSAAPQTCYHHEDKEDNKCYEARAHADGEFHTGTKGIASRGKCPSRYAIVDEVQTAEQCPDGMTNVKYCKSTAIEVTIASRSVM